jgi:TonB family protein
MMRRLFLLQVVALVSLSPGYGQPESPGGPAVRPKAIYSPKPVYQPDWARRGLVGKGVVLLTVDKPTGKVTGARIVKSTGNQLLDGSALQAYSQWRFEPGTLTQIQMPFEFRQAPKAMPPKPAASRPPTTFYVIIIVLLALGVIGIFRKRRT